MDPEEPEPISFDSLQFTIDQILSQYHDTAVTVERSTLLTDPERRNRIWRCHLRSAATQAPDTVIVKQVNPEGYDPANPEAWDTWRLFKDWAGAQFLSKIAAKDAHGPAFCGGNIEQGCIVLEDLGEHVSLVEPLLGSDASAASEALMAFARRLGRMHAASIGKAAMYRDIRQQISPAWVEMDTRSAADDLLAREKQAAEFSDICKRVEVEPDDTAMQEFASVLNRLASLGPFSAFIHGDPCPDNVFYHAPQVKLIDFEFSRFGHAMLDGLYGRLSFPTCWCANAVPSEIVQKMENTYRRELSAACPEVMDDQRFGEEASVVTALWAFNSAQWGLGDLLEQDEEWGVASSRSRVLTRIGVFIDTAQSSKQLPALSDTFVKIVAELNRRWPGAGPLPLYPAFRTEC